jgi:hypothetical protein
MPLGRTKLDATLCDKLNLITKGHVIFQGVTKQLFTAMITINIGMIKGGNPFF